MKRITATPSPQACSKLTDALPSRVTIKENDLSNHLQIIVVVDNGLLFQHDFIKSFFLGPVCSVAMEKHFGHLEGIVVRLDIVQYQIE